MKKIVMVIITSMTILTNVFANDIKPIETLESKNEICILIDKSILPICYYEDMHSKYSITEEESGKWVTDFKIVADYYRYIAKNKSLGLGLGININPFLEFYDIYGVTKIKVPLTNRWFVGVGVGFGNLDTKDGVKTYHHEFFKLFTNFNFKNISIYLSYTQDIVYALYNSLDYTKRFSALNLGIGTKFII
ncbi:MAG: hypothetical protein LBU10_00635 [Endomicrobium sp.]|jgi:hypothetical protein|nr:hypothetical protein [Endomicrobium sp.]